MAARVLVTALLAPLLLAFVAAQGQHEHGPAGGPVVLHDVPDEGGQYVGNLGSLGYIIRSDEGKPVRHQESQLRIVQDGGLFFETTGPSSAHDYDGMNLAWVLFTAPGAYRVEGVAFDGTTPVVANFTGTVLPLPPEATSAEIRLEGLPDTVAVNEPFTFTFGLHDPAGDLLDHTDVLTEIRRADGTLMLRVHTHTHDELQELTYAFTSAGTYTIKLVGYNAFPTARGSLFPAVAATREIRAAGLAPPVLGAVSMEPRADPGMTLYATFDPDVIVGTFGTMRLHGVVLNDTTAMPVPHVDFHAVLTDRLGQTLFQSATLHEYDGVFELVVGQLPPGPYRLWLAADRGGWGAVQALDFTVVPAGAPLAAGPIIVDVTGLDALESGVPGEVDLQMRTAAGTPVMHAEVEFQILRDPGGVPLLIEKLHTHEDGRMGFTIALPEPGAYTLLLDPTNLYGEPTPVYYVNGIGGGRYVSFDVAQGPAPETPEPLETTASDDGSRDAPLPVAGLVAAVVAGAIGARKTRRAL